MSWRDSQFAPPQELIDLVVRDVIAPVLDRFGSDAREPLIAMLAVWTGDLSGNPVVVSSKGYDNDSFVAARGEIRLRFRKTFGGDRGIYHVEARFRDVRPDTGWTGFHFSGRFRFGPPLTLKSPDAVTSVYSDPDWHGPH